MLKPYFGCFFHTREYIKSQVNLVWRSETQCNKIVRWFKPEIRQHHLEKCGTDTLLNGMDEIAVARFQETTITCMYAEKNLGRCVHIFNSSSIGYKWVKMTNPSGRFSFKEV
jgi:hypothetical protein